MAALDLIKQSYDDSDEEDAQNTECLTEKSDTQKNSLPLPKSISKWKGIPVHEEVISDPSKHDGRIRSFEHERGNWATLVYINYDSRDAIRSWMDDAKASIENIEVFEEFHISLTRTLVLKFHWIEAFVESVKKLCCSVQRFSVEISGLKIYGNEEKTRTFLGLQCKDTDGTLLQLVEKLNDLLADYDLPPFYEEASFHVSFLWCLGNEEARLSASLPLLLDGFHRLQDEHPEELNVLVTEIYCKIGHRIYSFQLK